MVRRRIAEQPTSRLAIWARRIALFSLTATVVGIIIVRSGTLDIVPALATLVGALLLAVVAILLAFGAGVVIWTEGVSGMREAVTAFFIGLALVAYPLYLGAKAYRLPAIYDVTTDPIDPPKFEAIARLRPRDANPITYAGLYAAQQQHAAYSDIEPEVTDSSPQEAYDAVLKVITKRKWHIVDSRPPGAREGHVEAIARTPILGFREDVVVRIRSAPDGARIDFRSASRYGRHDLGGNAARVRALLEDVDDALTSAPEKPEKPEKAEKPEKPEKAEKKSAQKSSQAAGKGSPVRR